MHPADRIRGAKSPKLQGKTIVLGVTGSIAAVETVKLARELIRHGADVHAVLSQAGTAIVHPNALQFATGHEVDTKLDGSMRYLEMCGKEGKADLLLIAPCTSNTISKIANGIDDTTVTTYAVNALGSAIPLLIAPAAHETMMDNPAVLENVQKLRALGVEFVEPKREENKAKLADTEEIVARVIRKLGPRDLLGKRVLVIAGSTVEPIDDIRVVTNRSSGATGVELARSAFEHGAEVELWMGRHEVAVPSWLPARPFDTTAALAAMVSGAAADICLVPAAISDFSPRKQKGKIPSREGSITLALEPTPKVLAALRKATKGPLVGFKAESGVSAAELKGKAMALLKEAELDLVVANDVAAVKRDTTAITIFDRKGRSVSFTGSKSLAAEQVWRAVLHGVPG
ncbi:MAG TPA: bifunctional phosphopantothenoylcysteine decarboxylase/phosphopantothenate--cysteine ligase CoaBC [Thermoplasmata archaeon]|nr:bifunctional phosphopantothenoylcysteine decarboxylase/phosphopantothenate--cysteine ligase CoaBC [Thermoplasmata archaeon]